MSEQNKIDNEKHTPEPWRKLQFDQSERGDYDAVVGAENQAIIAHYDCEGFAILKERDLDHAIACVNGCAGINPEAVPEIKESLIEIHDICIQMGLCVGHGTIERARSALAKARSLP